MSEPVKSDEKVRKPSSFFDEPHEVLVDSSLSNAQKVEALDALEQDARQLAEAVRSSVGGLKLGLEFFNAHGPVGVRSFVEMGLPIFLDLKYHDIPNTVAGAVLSAAPGSGGRYEIGIYIEIKGG